MDLLKNFLAYQAYNLRRLSLIESACARSGHPTSCLSAADIVSVLFFHQMIYDPNNFTDPNNDRFILSKGHASALLYAVWHELGKMSEAELKTYRQFDSVLEGHPTFRFAYTEAATGALGTGLSIGVGQALAARLGNYDFCTYVLLGDGEIAEGAVWEAVQIAAHYRLDNLVAIVDCNGLGQSEAVLFDHEIARYKKVFEAFGWHTETVHGHDIGDLMHVFEKLESVHDMPKVILAKTVKGYGFQAVENKLGFHGKAFQDNVLESALLSLRKTLSDEDMACAKNYQWHPKLPRKMAHKITQAKHEVQFFTTKDLKEKNSLSTRESFGLALANLGKTCTTVVVLDADVKNSTYTEYFEQQFPERFFQCFIAEQNMVGMGVGFHRRGYIPFIATFAAFFSRAHDHIRMAAIGKSALRLVGSHAGVSIGEDGPSQMGLEDIALMRCLPESIVLYPCDGVSTYKLVEAMMHYDAGISYLRTTRMTTPILYHHDEQFFIGGSRVIRQSDSDVCTVVAAGVTLFEALKAYDILKNQQQSVLISVIDCYSIKPIDTATIVSVAKKSQHKIITVEDHYSEGGLGEAVRSALAQTNIQIQSLAVPGLPRSGTPEKLLSWASIDSHSIVAAVRTMIHSRASSLNDN